MNKIKNFMIGRYGYDQFNLCIFITSFVFNVIYMLSHHMLFLILNYLCLIYFVYRALSKNIPARQSENYIFLDKTKIIRRFFIATKNNLKDKNNHYYLCPNCYQVVRVPKGRGKVEIHCPKCNKVFKKKS